jgi:hypothetical protein
METVGSKEPLALASDNAGHVTAFQCDRDQGMMIAK